MCYARDKGRRTYQAVAPSLETLDITRASAHTRARVSRTSCDGRAPWRDMKHAKWARHSVSRRDILPPKTAFPAFFSLAWPLLPPWHADGTRNAKWRVDRGNAAEEIRGTQDG